MLHRDADGSNRATRGDVRAHVVGAAAARAVGAVMLARANGQPELEHKARALVASGDVRSRDVRYWAEQFRERSPVDISDLEATAPGLGWRRRPGQDS
jgi:hypothetical protein